MIDRTAIRITSKAYEHGYGYGYESHIQAYMGMSMLTSSPEPGKQVTGDR